MRTLPSGPDAGNCRHHWWVSSDTPVWTLMIAGSCVHDAMAEQPVPRGAECPSRRRPSRPRSSGTTQDCSDGRDRPERGALPVAVRPLVDDRGGGQAAGRGQRADPGQGGPGLLGGVRGQRPDPGQGGVARPGLRRGQRPDPGRVAVPGEAARRGQRADARPGWRCRWPPRCRSG